MVNRYHVAVTLAIIAGAILALRRRFPGWLMFALPMLCVLGCPLDPLPPTGDGGAGGEGATTTTGGSHPVGCVDGPPCAPSTDPCHVATCEPNGSCSYSHPAPEGDSCNSGKGVCDGAGSCVIAGHMCMTGDDCDDGDSCTGDVCFAASKTCGHYIMPACVQHECSSTAQCDDGNECTLDVCNTFSGKCFNTSQPDGFSCDGGVGVCQGGVCTN